jgi:endo-1,3(4)-beta-glucanase
MSNKHKWRVEMKHFYTEKRKRRLRWAHALTALLLMITSMPFLSALPVQAAETDSYLLSMNRSIYASSSLGGNTPDMAVDDNVYSRWESVWKKDSQWIYVDLGASATSRKLLLIGKMRIPALIPFRFPMTSFIGRI